MKDLKLENTRVHHEGEGVFWASTATASTATSRAVGGDGEGEGDSGDDSLEDEGDVMLAAGRARKLG